MKILRKMKLWIDRVKKYKLVSLSDFCNSHKIDKKVIFLPETIEINKEPISCYPLEEKISISTSYKTPGCSIYRIRDVSIMGRSEFLFKDGFMIHHDNFDPHEHISSIGQLKKIKYFNDFRECRIRHKKNGKPIKKGIVLLGGGSGNYAHFFCDLIPRLIISNYYSEFNDYPILVDSFIGKILLGIIIKFNIKNKEIILIDELEKIKVDDLIFISFPSYLPHDFKPRPSGEIIIKNDIYKISKNALQLINKETSNLINLASKKQKKKLYLFRDNVFKSGVQYNIRSLENQNDIIRFLKKRGFYIVNTTEMNFDQQVSLMRDAEIVISPVGAALTNMIFSNQKTIFVVLAGHYKNANYAFWTNFSSVLGRNLFYVLGRQIVDSTNSNIMHRNYFIELNQLEECLIKVEEFKDSQ